MANKAYQFRIYPNEEQKTLLARTFGCVRFVYNRWLERRIRLYREKKSTLTYTMCAKELAELKKQEGYSFLKEVDSIALQQSLRHLDGAFRNFFQRPQTGFPRFKSRKHRNSYSTVCVNGNITIADGHVKLPKIGRVKVKQHRPIPEGYVLKSATVSCTSGGRYYVSLLHEYEAQVQEREIFRYLGMDYTMHELYKDSSGGSADYPGCYRKAEEKLKREQKKLSRMQKGSKNREKQRIKVARLHERIANQRKDFLHKKSRQITNAWDCVCVEELDMKVMSQTMHFGKSVSDNGWGMFVSFLKYKLEEEGKKLVKVGKYFASSQTCSCCGYQNAAVKDLSIREWDCPVCGVHHDRDVNAAINIRNEGMRILLA